MDDTLRHIVDEANDWMGGGVARSNQNMWLVADNNDDAMDLAFALAQARGIPKHKAEVRYDKPPVLVGVNAQTGRCLWVLTQPNQIPTVQVTMNRVVSKLREGNASQEERTKLSKIVEQVGGDPNKDLAGNPLSLNSGENERLFEPIAPSRMIIDQREPMWNTLSEFITEDTDITLTDNVERRPANRQELNEFEADSDEKLDRYNPDSD